MNTHAVRFRINEENVHEPRWWVDLWLLDTVVRDVVELHKPIWWRFHRRSWPTPPEVGHQFSFMFEAEDESPKGFPELDLLNNHKVTKKFKAEYGKVVVQRMGTNNDPIQKRYQLDKNWSPEMCSGWKHFIHGASAQVLETVRYCRITCLGDSGHHEGEDKLYPIVEEAMTSHWERFGSHALFHHLSALWGYKPLAVKF